MIRENYGGSSNGGDINLNNYVTKSDLNNDVVEIIQNIDYNTYNQSTGLKELIKKETVNNFKNNFTNNDFNNMTNLNKWIDYKLTDVSSGLLAKEINHKPISNINFNYKVNNGYGNNVAKNYSFNTNNLVFYESGSKTSSDGIKVKTGDVVFIFFKDYYDEIPNYVVDKMLIIICGFSLVSATISKVVSSGSFYYYKANPFYNFYYHEQIPPATATITMSTNANCMLTTNFTNTIDLPFEHDVLNYYYLWSGDAEFIDFLNVFGLDDFTHELYTTNASGSTINTNIPRLVDQSFYAIKQRNIIQNEVVKMFSDTSILNDLKLIKNIYQGYSISSIYTYGENKICPLRIGSTQYNVNVTSTQPQVYIAFFKDNNDITCIDLAYSPNPKKLGYPNTNVPSTIGTNDLYFKCNNIFTNYNDLVITLKGRSNLSRNISIIINFMTIRYSEDSTHLLIKSSKCDMWSLVSQITNSFTIYDIGYINFNNLTNYTHLLDLDKLIDEKQGSIMNTQTSDNIVVEF